MNTILRIQKHFMKTIYLFTLKINTLILTIFCISKIIHVDIFQFSNNVKIKSYIITNDNFTSCAIEINPIYRLEKELTKYIHVVNSISLLSVLIYLSYLYTSSMNKLIDIDQYSLFFSAIHSRYKDEIFTILMCFIHSRYFEFNHHLIINLIMQTLTMICSIIFVCGFAKKAKQDRMK